MAQIFATKSTLQFPRTVNWSNLYRMDSVIDQFAHFTHDLSLSMDKHLPLRKTKYHTSDKPCLNEDIKDVILKILQECKY